MQSHARKGSRHVKGMSPPGVAENNQIILSGDTSSFWTRWRWSELPASLSPSVCLPPRLSRSYSTPPPPSPSSLIKIITRHLKVSEARVHMSCVVEQECAFNEQR